MNLWIQVCATQPGVTANSQSSTCKRDLHSRPQQRLGARLSPSRQARAACGVVGTRMASAPINSRGGDFPHPLSRCAAVARYRVGIDGDSHCASAARRSRRTQRQIGQNGKKHSACPGCAGFEAARLNYEQVRLRNELVLTVVGESQRGLQCGFTGRPQPSSNGNCKPAHPSNGSDTYQPVAGSLASNSVLPRITSSRERRRTRCARRLRVDGSQ